MPILSRGVHFLSVLLFFPYIFFGLSIGGIAFILVRNRERIVRTLAAMRHNQESSAPSSHAPSTTSFFAGVQNIIPFGVARIRLIIPRIFAVLQIILRFFRGGADSRTLLKERFENNTRSGLRVHSLASAPAQDAHAVSAAAITATSVKAELKIVKRLQDHSVQKEQEGKLSSEEEFWLGVLRQNPRNPHPYKRLAEIYMQRQEYVEARAALAYVLRRNPEDAEAGRWMEDVRKLSNKRQASQSPQADTTSE